MNITAHFSKTVSVYHLADETGDKRGYPATADLTTTGMLQPMSSEGEAMSDGQFAKGSKLFTPIVDIREGDKIVIDSIDYRVKGVKSHNYGNEPHLAVFIHLPNS